MTTQDTALQLTLAAIEKNVIFFDRTSNALNEKREEQNAHNVKQIVDFYNTLFKTLDHR